MLQNIQQDEKNLKRLRLLIFSRIGILSVFLLVTIFWGTLNAVIPGLRELQYLIYAVISVMYLLSLVYIILLKKRKYLQINIYLQLLADILLVSLLVYLTGGIASNYSLFYILLIIYAAIFLGRYGALMIASISSAAYALVLAVEYLHVYFNLYPIGYNHPIDMRDIIIRIIVHVFSYFTVAFLASFVVEQERKTRSLLEEKESAFNQLDLLFRSIIESVDTGILTTTLQGRIKTFNRAAETITGFSFGEIKNRHLLEIFPEFSTVIEETQTEFIKSRREFKITNKQGAKVYLGCSISPLKSRYGEHIGHILIFQDLTEIKRMEENLEKSRKLALIGEMAAALAHEMRNPLASIAGSVELLSQETTLEETDKRLMQIILRGKDQLDSFVRDFLLLARPVPERREPVRMNEIAEEVIENIKLSGDWTQEMNVIGSFSEPNVILANKNQIRQVLQNLVLNAAQAMNRGGNIVVEIKKATAENGAAGAEIRVSDEGCGIEEKDLKNVFEPFFTNKDKGTGLGLAIVNRIVDGYGGKINIQSIVNQGTTVTIWLPCGLTAGLDH